jgi:ribosomal protein S18 acetylase RimI-like enzyme
MAVNRNEAPAWHLPREYGLRPREEADIAFLRELYAATREDELRPLAWPAQQKQAFLFDQFDKQHAHYLQHYPQARWWVVTHGGVPVGRLYVARTERDLRIMDVTLQGAHRNRGLGTALMRALLEQAQAAGVPASLHVEPFNPALRLYRRLGFVHVETRGVYLFMERPCSVEDDLVAHAAFVAADGHHEQIQAPMRRVD